YNFKIKDTRWQLGLGPNLNQNRNVDFINGQRNFTTRSSYGAEASISQYVKDKYNFYIGPSFSWNQSHASVNSSSDVQYWQLQGWAQGSVTIPGNSGVEIATDINYQVRQKDPRFPQANSFTTWNANILKRLMKN